MLTVLDAISVAGDRAKQNDDVCGAHGNLAWVIDGATDLHDAPLSGAASDAAWVARELDRALHGADVAHVEGLRRVLRDASADASRAFTARAPDAAAWLRPIASALMLLETADGLCGLDLGDCRLFALGADEVAGAYGGPVGAADREEEFVKQITQGAPARSDGALWRTPDALATLRNVRTQQVLNPAQAAVFSLDPACADAARAWTLHVARPGYALLATDGFSALVDRYDIHDAAGLITAARKDGLAQLATQLRAIESADASSIRHPRFKRSDDATALLLRLD